MITRHSTNLTSYVQAGDSVVFSVSPQPYGIAKVTSTFTVALREPCPLEAFFHQNATFYGWGAAAIGSNAIGLSAFDERSRATDKQVVNMVQGALPTRPFVGVRVGAQLPPNGDAAKQAVLLEIEMKSSTSDTLRNKVQERVPPPVEWKESSKLPTALMDQIAQYLGAKLQLGIGFNSGTVSS